MIGHLQTRGCFNIYVNIDSLGNENKDFFSESLDRCLAMFLHKASSHAYLRHRTLRPFWQHNITEYKLYAYKNY